MKAGRTILILILVAAAFVAGYGYGRWYGPGREHSAPAQGDAEILGYHCPMHPTYTSDRPGDCPICGMRLVPIRGEEQPAALDPDRKILHYRDPEDHSYTSEHPGLNPATGNELEPVYAKEAESELPPGVFHVSTQRQQLIGVRYGQAEITRETRTIRAVGKVELDETRVARIHPKIEGWIENVFVDFIGKHVEKGQPLLTIYSPEMLATQEEFLLALQAKRVLSGSSLSSVAEDSDALIVAARRRLELWDLSEFQIEQVRRTGKPIRNVTLDSPISGYVTTRNAFPRQRVMPDTELYTVVDLSRVWVMADVFEFEAPAIRMGQPGVVTLSYHPGRSFPARVNYIQPSLDPATRTLKVRLEVDNPGLLLKPEMFADVEFRAHMPPMLTVPVEAVLDSGIRKTVFVDHGNGRLEPRHVETGARFRDRIEILKGLKAGERIVVSGAFLIDSESQLKAAAAGMAPHQHGEGAAPAAPPGGHQHD